MTTLRDNPTTSNTANEHTADHDVLHEWFNEQVIWIPAPLFVAASGSPVIQLLMGSVGAFAMDAAADESIVAAVQIPDDWATYHADIIWGIDSSSGNVVWNLGVQALNADTAGTGTILSSGSWITIGTVTDAATSGMVETRMATGTAHLGSEYHVLRILRDADNGADTFGADAEVVGLRLTKAS